MIFYDNWFFMGCQFDMFELLKPYETGDKNKIVNKLFILNLIINT